MLLTAVFPGRSDRFGTALKEPSGVHSLDSALGGGSGGKGRGAAPRLSRLELMAKRREEATKKNRGFATGFDILSEEESRKREERAARYGAALLGDAPSEAPLAVFEEAAAKRAARAAKFGRDAAAAAGGVEVGADVLEPRRDALGDAEVRHECVYLYGVDTMSTKDCTKYFADFSPVFVEWINDSSCNVVFADAYTAKRAMHGTGTQEAPTVGAETAAAADDAAPMEGGDAAAQPHPECAWRKGVDFIKADGSHIPLCFRLATTDDVKPDGETVSRYLWCGGARPPPPARRGRASAGKKRRRRRDDDEGDGDGDVFEEGDGEAPMDAQAEQAGGDLREELKRRRAAAPEAEVVPPAVDAPMDVGEQAAQDAASVVTVPAVLPPGDLRVRLEHGLVPDFGNDGL